MDEALDQLRRELADMRMAMERQQTAMERQQTAMDVQQSRIAELEGAGSELHGGGKLRNRRQVLKLAGATIAGAAAAAAGIGGSAVPALAATGGNMILGNTNTADAATRLDYTGATTAGVGFMSQIGTVFNPTQFGGYEAAVAGITSASHTPHAVFGYTNQAVGRAVTGYSASGIGVYGIAGTYGGQFSGTKAPLLLFPSSSTGAPAPAGHQKGELFVDSIGLLYYFMSGAFYALSSTNMLTAPIRLLESRPSYQDPSTGQTKPGRPINNGETWDLPITGQVMGGISVPAGAKAVIGNVTVVNPATAGFLTLFPFGATRPNTSSINFTAGQTIANGVTVGLSSAGHLAIFAAAQTDVLFDASGFVM